MVILQYGPGNRGEKAYTHTDQITDTDLAFLGASRENCEFRVNGAQPYRGVLEDGDIVDVVQRANSKACAFAA